MTENQYEAISVISALLVLVVASTNRSVLGGVLMILLIVAFVYGALGARAIRRQRTKK